LSISSQCIAQLEDAGCPVFLFSDSAWLTWQEAYKGTISEIIEKAWFAEQEAQTARRIDGLCFGSTWAVEEAERIYQGESFDASLRTRLHVTPLGANWTPKLTRAELLARIDGRAADALELLYLGKDWIRKGGPLAVEVSGLLRRAGHTVRLHVVGCRPELPSDTADFVTVHGPLYQNDAAQSAILAELFLRSHFLIVPTLAECFGIVFAEAQAFGLPPISRAVHALPTVIADGETGILMDPSAPASAYVERIVQLWSKPAEYRQMAVKARDRFEQILNWDKTAEEIVRLMSLKVAAQRAGK
jgi:glycosyltransferase involved in cell wall biosynthesis